MNPALLSMPPHAHLGPQYEQQYVTLAAGRWFRGNLTRCQRQESPKWLPKGFADAVRNCLCVLMHML